MSRYHRHDKPDKNTAAIVEGLRSHGYVVEYIARPVDLLVGANGHWIPVEVKNPERRERDKRTRAQIDFMSLSLARGLDVLVVEGLDEALERIAALTRTSAA